MFYFLIGAAVWGVLLALYLTIFIAIDTAKPNADITRNLLGMAVINAFIVSFVMSAVYEAMKFL